VALAQRIAGEGREERDAGDERDDDGQVGEYPAR
jgi:hypothetical protein